MNLSTATLLAKRFLEDVVEGGLLNKLTLVLDAAKSEDPDVLRVTAKEAFEAGQESLFHDVSLKVFPEFKKLGFDKFLGEEKLQLIGKISGNSAREEHKVSGEEMANIVQVITDESENLKELSNELQKLTSLADYFKVEENKPIEAPAVSIFKFLEDEKTKNVDGFIEQMQLFQNLLSQCEAETNITNNNIRMISGDEPIIVADMSSKGALKLQAIVELVCGTKQAYEEIDKAEKRLKTFKVRDELLTALKDEADLIKSFKAGLAETFFDENFDSDEKETIRRLAVSLLNLFSHGATIDAVILQEEKTGEEQSAETVVEDAAPLDFEGVETSEKKENTAPATPFPESAEAEEQAEGSSKEKSNSKKPKGEKIAFYPEPANDTEKKLKGSLGNRSDDDAKNNMQHKEAASTSPLRSLWNTLLKK